MLNHITEYLRLFKFNFIYCGGKISCLKKRDPGNKKPFSSNENSFTASNTLVFHRCWGILSAGHDSTYIESLITSLSATKEIDFLFFLAVSVQRKRRKGLRCRKVAVCELELYDKLDYMIQVNCFNAKTVVSFILVTRFLAIIKNYFNLLPNRSALWCLCDSGRAL